MVFPKKLQKGDTIAIIAPSSAVSKEDVQKCEEVVTSMGYKVKLGNSVHCSLNGYCSCSGEDKAKEINEMFADKEVKAIWCIRGGDSSSHAMDKIDFELVKNNPKIFVGYSDITNLNINFNQKSNLVTFHGPMVKSNMINSYDNFTRKSFESAINMENELTLENPEGENFQVLKDGHAEGTVIGGNLCLLVSMIGTPYEMDTKGKILFIEEIEEDVRRIDRMMYQLKYSGKLEDSAGIIFGDFTGCTNKAKEEYGIIELFKDILKDYNKPVMYNIKSGHCSPMSTIPLGATCVMDTSKKSIVFKNN